MKTKNVSLTLPTSAQILERYKARAKDDMFGFEASEYFRYLAYEDVKGLLKPKTTKREWEQEQEPLSRKAILKTMVDYMDFAWDKANNCRGLSANRSIGHYVAWTWLAGEPDFSKEIEDATYEFYGKGILVKICEHYGWDSSKWDDGVRTNTG